MSNSVLVIDTNKQPCNPVNPGMARRLLKEGKVAVFRRYPFTIILKEERNKEPTPCQVKIDPGSKTTGIVPLGFSTGLGPRGGCRPALCASICLKSGIAPVPTVVLKTPRWKWSTLCRNLRGAAIG